jgi:Bacterial Ig domain
VVFNPWGRGGPQPPVANNDSGIVASENTPLQIGAATLLGNDTDPNGLTISLNTVTSGTGGSGSLSGSTITFNPTGNYTGPASFTYTIKNSAALISGPATVLITVKAPAAPVANNGSGFVVIENLALVMAASALLGNDTDPGGLAISLNTVTAGTGGSVSLSGSTVTFAPSANYTGPANFTYTIKNAANLISAPATVSLTVVAPGTSSSLLAPVTRRPRYG